MTNHFEDFTLDFTHSLTSALINGSGAGVILKNTGIREARDKATGFSFGDCMSQRLLWQAAQDSYSICYRVKEPCKQSTGREQCNQHHNRSHNHSSGKTWFAAPEPEKGLFIYLLMFYLSIYFTLPVRLPDKRLVEAKVSLYGRTVQHSVAELQVETFCCSWWQALIMCSTKQELWVMQQGGCSVESHSAWQFTLLVFHFWCHLVGIIS